MILYGSTRNDKKFYTFSKVILKGIASDGGLFVPTEIPKLSPQDLELLLGKSYQEVCFHIINLFETDFSANLLKKIIFKAYGKNFDNPQITPLIHLKDNQYILELWHGPTSAFKDIALQIMPQFFANAAKKSSHKYLILIATSGDTGKAALEGYKDKEGISIIVFYPENGVSKLQELQMTTQEGKNLTVIGVKGNFDDVQRCVKEVLNDEQFNNKLLNKHKTVLSSANSINWGRLLPQIVYYISGYLNLVRQKVINLGNEIDIAVPTGNFGNIVAAFYAKKMGLPIRKLICATNENNILTEFLITGVYDISNRSLIKTPSPSMDIIVASNLERLLYEITKNPKMVIAWMEQLKDDKKFEIDDKTIKIIQEIFYSDWVSNEDSLDTIKRVYKDNDYLIDPHTAVVQEVVEKYQKRHKSNIPVVICSTAHWSKFPSTVYEALKGFKTNANEFALIEEIRMINKKISIPQNILELKNKKVLHEGKIRSTKEDIKKIILQYISKW